MADARADGVLPVSVMLHGGAATVSSKILYSTWRIRVGLGSLTYPPNKVPEDCASRAKS